jgi:potassium-dependent mechanosensitive channel
MAQQRSKRYRNRDHALALFTDSVTASAAEYMLHLEILYQKIDSIRSESRLRPEVLAAGQKLKANDSILHFISQNLSTHNHTLNLRNLQMFKILLEDTQKALKSCNKNLKAADAKLTILRNEIRLVRRDSMLRHLIRDTVARKKFLPQLKDLRGQWRLTDSLVRHSAATVNDFKTHASASAITGAQLLGRVEEQLNSAASKIFAREMPYLWQPSAAAGPAAKGGFKYAFSEEQKALNFYFKDSSANRLLRWITGIIFFWWVYANLRTLKRLGKVHVLAHYNITYLPTQSLAAAFIVTLSLAPIFDLQAPAAYVQFVQFLLLISLTFLYARQWPRKL